MYMVREVGSVTMLHALVVLKTVEILASRDLITSIKIWGQQHAWGRYSDEPFNL